MWAGDAAAARGRRACQAPDTPVGSRITPMKNPTTVLLLALLVVVLALLWRFETHLAPLAELARVQLADREEFRRNEKVRLAAEAKQAAETRAQAEATAAKQAAATAAAEQRARDEAARVAHLSEPVKPGEVVAEITLDNRNTVRDAVVVAVQPTSVSFKVGARLYNIPTEQLPAELRTRLRRMFPTAASDAGAGGAEPATQP